MLLLVLILLSFSIIKADDARIVKLDNGEVKGFKYWDGGFYEFYGIPYASAPTGRDRFKAPLPPPKWDGLYEAVPQHLVCHQKMMTGEDEGDAAIGMDECLMANLFVPNIATKDNLLPVVVYIHSGAFAIGHSTMARYNYLVLQDVVVVAVNYRLGAIGFACLGTEEVPGNAGLKDLVAALKWINKNVQKFGGDPNKVTVAGFSVGAALAELLTYSKLTDGLIDKLILESGSAFAPWAINRNPIQTATNIALSLGFNNTGNLKDLNEFYLTASVEGLSIKSLNFYLPNGTFGFAPCLELDHEDAFLTESPVDLIKKGFQNNIPVITGFSNMEGLSRSEQFEEWSDDMEENFYDYLPTDLKFPDIKTRDKVAADIKAFYFKNQPLLDNIHGLIDYFSDSMFTYGILNSANIHASFNKSVYFYEFSYFGELSAPHRYADKIKGASHRDLTAYVLDFYSWTGKHGDMDTRDRLTAMWSDFIKYGNPTTYESSLIDFKWKKYDSAGSNYLSIGETVTNKRNLLQERFGFWNNIYQFYYNNPKNTDKSK